MEINFNRLTDKDLRMEISKLFVTALSETKTKNNVSVNITIVGEKEIRRLNKEFRQIDRVTDVLSFPLEENFDNQDFLNKDICSDLGDIVICKKRAGEQALEYGHSIKREMCFLALHGFLHLLGYDHMSKEEETQMFKLSDKILRKHNIGR